MTESTCEISGLGLEELKALLAQALEEGARLKAENAKLREEIARLKGLKGRPALAFGWPGLTRPSKSSTFGSCLDGRIRCGHDISKP